MAVKKARKPLHEYPDAEVGTSLHRHAGLDVTRRNAFHVLDDTTAISAAGNAVLFVNLDTGASECVLGPSEGGGIGAVCVHPSRKYYAVCEKRPQLPLVTVYEYPSRTAKATLSNGALRGYSACSFNKQGNLLATVAIDPDYVLTLWDWESESIVLRNKAFGADIYSVAFNPFNDGLLVTSGMGHIKFWTMASTFTGLKLQGQVGKFGRTEISDIHGFATFPDGKVLSGSESGSLLLWEGGLIKCELSRITEDGTAKAHTGPIDVVELVDNGRLVMTCGHDGCMRYWDFQDIDTAEQSADGGATPLRCRTTVAIPGAEIRGVADSVDGQRYLVQDGHGELRWVSRLPYDTIAAATGTAVDGQVTSITRCPAGAIRSAASVPGFHVCIIGGDDGVLRLLDYVARSILYETPLHSQIVGLQIVPPATAQQRGGTFLVAHGDGSIRLVRCGGTGFDVVAEAKPHSSSIVGAAISADGKQLYTVASDKTAFHFGLQERGFVPHGFCVLPGVPCCAEWAHEGDVCFVGFDNGAVLALNPPPSIDHSVGYAFDAVFAAVGYRQKMKPPVKEKKEPGTMEFGEQEPSSSDDDLDDDDEADVGPWGVQFIQRLPTHGLYLIGVDHKELCYEFTCQTRYPGALEPPPLPPSGLEPPGRVEEPMRNLAFRDTTVRSCAVSLSGGMVAIVTEHSGVLLRPTARPEAVTHAAALHDFLESSLCAAVLSFDDSVLITVGADGMAFTHSIAGKTPPGTSSAQDIMSSLPAPSRLQATAIEHCVQKQKELDDKAAAEEAALSKRERMFRKVHAVHGSMQELLEKNHQEVGGRRIPDEHLVLDPGMAPQLDLRQQEAVNTAKREFQWQLAKKATLAAKLKSSFVDNLLWDRFAVTGFSSPLTVASFRAARFTADQEESFQSIQQLLAPQDPESPAQLSPAATATPAPPSVAGESQDPEPERDAGKSTQKLSLSETAQLQKAEERKRERIARKRGLEALRARNPSKLPDDPQLTAEVTRAERFMGDYRLKTSAEYHIPEHLRPTAERKAKQLILLEHSTQQLRCDFNERLLELRDVKRRLCESMNSDRRRIQDICRSLKLPVDDSIFALCASEEPEKRFDADEAALDLFERETEKALRRAENLERAKKGFGADLATMDDEEEDEETIQARKAAEQKHKEMAARRASQLSIGLTAKDRFEKDLHTKLESIRATDLENEEAAATREALLFERARLERRIGKTVAAFDESLNDLFHEKLKLESDLCMADMRALLLFREFLLLQDFKKKDQELAQRLEARQVEKNQLLERSKLVLDRVNDKREETENITEALKQLKREFEQLIEEFPDAHKALDRLYGKRIKRSRRFQDDDEDDDDSSSSDDDEEEEDDEYADDGEEETCPLGASDEIFAAVLALREKRLDQDDRHAEVKKAADQLVKEHQQLASKEAQVDNHLQTVERDILQFQNEKQRRLNQLETIVVLKLSQLQCLTQQHKLPKEFTDDIVVFTQEGLQRLRRRIVDLGDEKIQMRHEMHGLQQEQQRLTRRKTKRSAEYGEWDAKVYEVQLLKFGQRVNLEMLENVSVDRETAELKAQLKAEELKAERELARQQEKLRVLRQQQQQRIAENTVALKELGTMRGDQRDLELALSQSAAKVVAKMAGGSKVATAADRAHLKDLVVAQQQEIDLLKAEITMLRRKGGHVYTPVVAQTAEAAP